MKLAVFADIHGNIQGLEAVLRDIEARGADLVWCGGDLVGYGANPGEVVEVIRRRGIPTVMGNPDDGAVDWRITCGCDYPGEEVMERGLRSVAWTKAQTTDAYGVSAQPSVQAAAGDRGPSGGAGARQRGPVQ